ncbi:MAG TPA: acyl carrier protein [Opitutaceae bacterium]
MLEAYQRYHEKGDAGAVQAVVIAAVVDYQPSRPSSPAPVTDETRLVEDMGYDSVAVAELVFFLEDLFDVTISNDELLRVRSIADLRACVTRKLAAKSPAA